MNREQAYEKLELPVGTDLQVVRQKFQQMHNDFQVQIDGSFSTEMRQRKERQLEELKEAFALLNESTHVDDSASLPHTEKTFDHLGGNPETQVPQENSSERERPWSSPYGAPSVLPQQPQPQPQATEPAAAPPGYTRVRVFREPKWWYVVITIPMAIAAIFFFAELMTGRGYHRGLFGQAFSWVAGTIIGNLIILNNFSPTLVPPYLRGVWFQGFRGGIVLFIILAVSGYLVHMLYTSGAANTKIYSIKWEHYTEYAAIGIVLLQLFWCGFIGLTSLVGLISPPTFYFRRKTAVVGAVVCLIGYQMALLFCLFVAVPSDTALRKISDDSFSREYNYYPIPEEYEEELTDSIM